LRGESDVYLRFGCPTPVHSSGYGRPRLSPKYLGSPHISAHPEVSSAAVVCCEQDSIPSELLKALEVHGFSVERVDDTAIQEVEKVWRRLGPDPRWLRAGFMSFLLSLQHQHGLSLSEEDPHLAALDCLYAFLRRQLEDLEALLWAEGKLPCPGHLSAYCPNCQPPLSLSDEQECPF